MSRLTPELRKQIISDYIHGIQNPEYRVIDRGDGTYQVRKRDSKFKALIKQHIPEDHEQEPEPEPPKPGPTRIEPEPEPEPEPPKPGPTRMTNEELLHKLSKLLDVPQQADYDTPEEYDHEKEAYEEDQDYIQQNINTNFNPYMRKPLRLY